MEKPVPAGRDERTPPRRPFRQTVLQELGQIGKYRVRLVKASDKPDAEVILDVREYVTGANYEGFTRKGIRLGLPEVAKLCSMLAAL